MNTWVFWWLLLLEGEVTQREVASFRWTRMAQTKFASMVDALLKLRIDSVIGELQTAIRSLCFHKWSLVLGFCEKCYVIIQTLLSSWDIDDWVGQKYLEVVSQLQEKLQDDRTYEPSADEVNTLIHVYDHMVRICYHSKAGVGVLSDEITIEAECMLRGIDPTRLVRSIHTLQTVYYGDGADSTTLLDEAIWTLLRSGKSWAVGILKKSIDHSSSKVTSCGACHERETGTRTCRWGIAPESCHLSRWSLKCCHADNAGIYAQLELINIFAYLQWKQNFIVAENVYQALRILGLLLEAIDRSSRWETYNPLAETEHLKLLRFVFVDIQLEDDDGAKMIKRLSEQSAWALQDQIFMWAQKIISYLSHLLEMDWEAFDFRPEKSTSAFFGIPPHTIQERCCDIANIVGFIEQQ